MKLLTQAVLCTICVASGVFSTNTDVSGTVSSDITWDSDTVSVVGDVSIDNGVTVTIAPGTVVLYKDYYGITVNGTVMAKGTESDSIRFTPIDTTTSWKPFVYKDVDIANDTSFFEYCVFEYGITRDPEGPSPSWDPSVFSIRNFSKIKVTDSEFTFCNSNNGIISVSYSNIIVSNNIFKDNLTAPVGVYSGKCTITNNVFKNNNDVCISLGIDSSIIQENVFINNEKLKYGSCISMGSKSATFIKRNKFIGNSSGNWGGVLYISNSTPVFIDNIFMNNHCDGDGGVCFIEDSASPLFINCLFHHNTSANHGAILYSRFGGTDIPIFINCTITANDGSAGYFLYQNSASVSILYNCIIWGNDGHSLTGIYSKHEQAKSYGRNCLISNHNRLFEQTPGESWTFAIDTANMFIANPDFIDAAGTDYELKPTSAAINAGTTVFDHPDIPESHKAFLDQQFDLNGEDRIVGSAIDIGAYEFQSPTAVKSLPIHKAKASALTLHTIQPGFSILGTGKTVSAKNSVFLLDGKAVGEKLRVPAFRGVVRE